MLKKQAAGYWQLVFFSHNPAHLFRIIYRQLNACNLLHESYSDLKKHVLPEEALPRRIHHSSLYQTAHSCKMKNLEKSEQVPSEQLHNFRPGNPHTHC